MTVTKALEQWFDLSLDELPPETRKVAEAYIPRWSELSASERRTYADQVDRAENSEGLVAWYDVAMSAQHWFALQDVVPEEAAKLLCRLNPDKGVDPARTFVDDDEKSPQRYRQLLRAFEDVARTAPKHRTLREWLSLARERELPYHPWIDQYVTAIDAIPTMLAGKESLTDKTGNDDWVEKAISIANRIGQQRWKSGQQEITSRNICEDVAAELAKDETTWGVRGPRSAHYVRTAALRRWKFSPGGGD